MLNVIVWAIVACLCTSAFGGTMSSDRYYTWGISGDDLNIPEGSIITEAVLTIQGITNWDNNLHIHIVDNPPLDFVANVDDGSGDFFQDFDGLLSGYSYDLVDGDLVITFSQINDPDSWVWDIFDPFNFQTDYSDVSYTSSLLELIDYAGNSTPFGIGLDPDGNSYNFQAMTLDLTLESYEGQLVRSDLTFTTTGDPYLTGYWSMDDNASSTTVVDSSGNGNNGLSETNTSELSTAGVVGDALAFGGSEKVVVSDDSSLDFGTGDFAISLWMKTNGYVNGGSFWNCLVSKGLVSGTESPFYGIYLSRQNRVYFVVGSDSNLGYSNTTLNDGSFHHIVGLREDGSVLLYVDGILQSASGLSSMNVSSNADFIIGADSLDSRHFNGVIDDVKVYNNALSQEEISDLYIPLESSGIAGHWSMDDNASSTTVVDSSGNGNNGLSETNTSELSTAGVVGDALVSKGLVSGTESPFYGIYLSRKNRVYFVVGSDSNLGYSNTTLNDGSFHHIVGLREDGVVYLYVDGVLQDVYNGSSVNITNTADFIIGADSLSTRYFDGAIDDVKIYGRALTPTEITLLYNLVP
jgi:hypothetical protein